MAGRRSVMRSNSAAKVVGDHLPGSGHFRSHVSLLVPFVAGATPTVPTTPKESHEVFRAIPANPHSHSNNHAGRMPCSLN